MENDLFKGFGVRVTLKKRDDFLKVMETLTRIGISSKDNVLYQSAHILHKRNEYAILHFKELFALDGKYADIVENDIARRNTIANLLAQWGLVTLVDPKASEAPVVPATQMKILPYAEKSKWQLRPKYTIGAKKKREQDGNF